jgi:hypothetical protein
MQRREHSGLSIQAAIIIAACIVVFVPLGYIEYQSRALSRAFATDAQRLHDEAAARRYEKKRQQSIRSLNEKIAERHLRAALKLPSSQQCVAGTVVIQRTSRDGSASFVQLLEGGRPVRCERRNRLEPRR